MFKKIGTTALLSMALGASVHASMYAWNATSDGKLYTWSSDGNPPPAQFYSWRAPDGSASYWSYSTSSPHFYPWNAPYYYPPMYFYYPMYPYGGMYYYQFPPQK